MGEVLARLAAILAAAGESGLALRVAFAMERVRRRAA